MGTLAALVSLQCRDDESEGRMSVNTSAIVSGLQIFELTASEPVSLLAGIGRLGLLRMHMWV